MKEIYFERKKHLGIITLTRPEALNALSLPMIKAFYKQLMTWKKDSSVHAVVLTAEGERAFCAGGDVRWLYQMGRQDPTVVDDFFFHEYRLNLAIGTFDKPYIALLNGLTLGGGVGIGLHGSHPIATERFVFGMPETAIGLFPDVGASHLLSRLPGGLGMYLALTGQRLSMPDALSVGLVKYAVPEKSCQDIIENLAASDLTQDPMLAVDRCIGAVRLEPDVLPSMDKAYIQMIKQSFTQPTLAAILGALTELNTPWALETFDRMKTLSPMSLKVTFLQMQKASVLNLAQCLEMDAQLVKHFVRGHDVYEGIRAAVIDKDKTPHWEPTQLEHISEEQVNAYFKP